MRIYAKLLLLVFLIRCSAGGNNDSSNEFNTFLFDVGFYEDVKTKEFKDRRRYDWLMESCDFTDVNNSNSLQCNFGSTDKQWHVFYGTNIVREKEDNRPVYPSLGFWSEKEASATLYSDPVPCLMKGTAIINLNLWVRGMWQFQICFIHMKNGTELKCGSLVSSRNLMMHKMRIDEPFPDYVFDSDIGPVIVSLRAAIRNGVILLDDINVVGVHCNSYEEEKQPISLIDVKDYESLEENVRNALLAPITKKDFKRYLSTIMKRRRLSRDKFPEGHICEYIRCRSAIDENCYYDGSLGIFPWSMDRRQMLNNITLEPSVYSMYVAEFPANRYGYAILTSPKLSFDNALLNSNKMFAPHKGKFQLYFTYNKAAYKRTIIVCHHLRDSTDYKCARIVKPADQADKDWITTMLFIPQKVDTVQIVVVQHTVFDDHETGEVIIRDINVINCYDIDK